MILEYGLVFSIVIVASMVFGYIRPYYRALEYFAVAGIMIHELCHYAMCLLTNVRVAGARIIPKDYPGGGYGGEVTPSKDPNFLQTVLISFAPLFIGTYLVAFILHLILTPGANLTISLILILLIISIIAGISPSKQDIHAISLSWRASGTYNYIQLGILSIAILLCIFLVDIYSLLVFDALLTYFVLTMILYYVVKYSGYLFKYFFTKVFHCKIRIKRTSYDILKKERKKYKGKNKVPYSPQTQW